MQGFMKTIISALQTWVNKRIKSNTPDWDQNDSDGDGYIKNRPFYEYEGKVVIAAETTISSDNGESNLIKPLVVGNTYTVTFDGVDYECVCREYDGYYMLGNNAIYEYDNGVTTDTGEPFAVETAANDTSMWWYLPEGDTMEHTVSISGLSIATKKLDVKYLPDEVLAQPDYDIYDETQTGYIKNRPCYYRGQEYVNEEAITFRSDSVFVHIPHNCFDSFIDGTDYVIKGTIRYTRNGETKKCSFDYARTYYKNDGAFFLFIYPDNSNDNFYIEAVYPNNSTAEYAGEITLRDFNGDAQIAVNDFEMTIAEWKELDEHVIPDVIARKGDLPVIDQTLSIEGAVADAKAVSIQMAKPKDYISLVDQVNGYTYLISMYDGNLVSSIGVKSIEVTTMPTTTAYMHGAYFDTTGMVVTATCYDGTTKEITDYIYTSDYLTEGTTSVELTYAEAGADITTTVPVTVSAFDPAVVLVDFAYTDNGDGTYTITGWNGTYNGEASTEMIIPNYGCIIV